MIKELCLRGAHPSPLRPENSQRKHRPCRASQSPRLSKASRDHVLCGRGRSVGGERWPWPRRERVLRPTSAMTGQRRDPSLTKRSPGPEPPSCPPETRGRQARVHRNFPESAPRVLARSSPGPAGMCFLWNLRSGQAVQSYNIQTRRVDFSPPRIHLSRKMNYRAAPKCRHACTHGGARH